MGIVIAILQKKGGATKTTTAVNLTMALREIGKDAVLADMDKDKPDAIFWADNGKDLVDLVYPLFDENPKKALTELKNKHDIVILDTPPNFGAAALKAAIMSDWAIIPCSPSSLDMKSLSDAAECAIMADIGYKFLLSRTVKNTIITNELRDALGATGEVFNTQVTNSVNISSSVAAGQWVGSYKPGCPNHNQYRKLAAEVLEFIKIPLKSDSCKEETV